MKRKIMMIAAVLCMCTLLAGCSMSKFIATGQEFSQICTDAGLSVEDVRSYYTDTLGYKSVTDAYTATDPDEKYNIQYVCFGKTSEAEDFYQVSAAKMSGDEEVTRDYSIKSETVKGNSRKLLLENGRVLYAEGETKAIDSKIASLTSGWFDGSDEGTSKQQAQTDASAQMAGTAISAVDAGDGNSAQASENAKDGSTVNPADSAADGNSVSAGTAKDGSTAATNVQAGDAAAK